VAEPVRLVGIAAVLFVAIIDGLTRTVAVNNGLLAAALIALASVVLAGWSNPTTSLGRMAPIDTTPAAVPPPCWARG
jgi:hypothetical protein